MLQLRNLFFLLFFTFFGLKETECSNFIPVQVTDWVTKKVHIFGIEKRISPDSTVESFRNFLITKKYMIEEEAIFYNKTRLKRDNTLGSYLSNGGGQNRLDLELRHPNLVDSKWDKYKFILFIATLLVVFYAFNELPNSKKENPVKKKKALFRKRKNKKKKMGLRKKIRAKNRTTKKRFFSS